MAEGARRVRDYKFIKQEERELNQKLMRQLKSLLEDNPNLRGLAANVEVRLFKKAPAGFYEYLLSVLREMIASSEFRALPNRKIVAHIQTKFPKYKVPSGVLDRPLTKYTKPKVARILSDHGISLDLALHDSLSKIKRALSGRIAASKSSRTVEVRVAFTDETVVVEDRVYKIVPTAGGLPRIKVDGQQLRADVLETLLSRDS